MISKALLLVTLFGASSTLCEGCTDGSLRFKIFKDDGTKRMRSCQWVVNKPSRCALDGVTSACPSTCGSCYNCQDSTLRFKVVKPDGRKIMRSCEWVANFNTFGRCSIDGVAQACRLTCDSCYEFPTPTSAPSRPPSPAPSPFPTARPSKVPSAAPSDLPSIYPSDMPSDIPSKYPSDVPSHVPSDAPSEVPSKVPSDSPTN